MDDFVEDAGAAAIDSFHRRLMAEKPPAADEDLRMLGEILERQFRAFSRATAETWEKRHALQLALAAIDAYLQHRLPRTPTMLGDVICALLDPETGVANPLFRPDPGAGKKGAPHKHDMRMALTAAIVQVIMNGGENEKAACSRVSIAAGCTAVQIEDWRDKRRHERPEWVRKHHDQLIEKAEAKITAGQSRSAIVSGMLKALKNG